MSLHGSWLNLVEGIFSNLMRQMLREIRVTDKEERIERIYKYFAEINDSPIVYDWKYHMCEIDPEEAIGLANLNRYTSTLLTLKLWIKPF